MSYVFETFNKLNIGIANFKTRKIRTNDFVTLFGINTIETEFFVLHVKSKLHTDRDVVWDVEIGIRKILIAGTRPISAWKG